MAESNKKYYIFKYNIVTMNVVSLLILIVLAIGTYYLYNSHANIFVTSSSALSDLKFVLFIIGMMLWLFLHEIIHAISYIVNGAKFQNIETGIAIEKGVLYCSCKEYITRKNIMISSLAPLISIGIITYIIGFIIQNPYLIIYSIFNISGAAGDIVLFNLLRKLPKDIQYREYDDVLAFCISSKKDLSKIKSFGVTFDEVLEDDAKITKCRNKHFYISKLSIIFILIIIAMLSLTAFYAIK